MTRHVQIFLSAVLVLLDLLFAMALLVLPAAWFLDPLVIRCGPLNQTIHWGWKPILAPVALLLVRALFKRWIMRPAGPVRGLWESALVRKAVLALAVTYAMFGTTEAILGLAGFQASLPPVVFQGQDESGGVQVEDTIPDPELMFRLAPGTYFAGRRINSLGFREREVDPKKSPGTIRVICMGDSVTAQGLPGYSQYLHERLTNDPPTPQPWEAFNIGVHGYTSLQGLRQFQKIGRTLAPDVVTLYFGWNDHWLSAASDRQQMGLEMRPWAGRIFEVLSKKRFFQYFVWMLNPVQHLASRGQGGQRVFRVAPEEYRSTLRTFVKEIRGAGAIPILITAPRRALVEGIVGKEYARTVAEAEAAHDRYVEITREVARDTGAVLLDLAALLAGPDCDRYFFPDGIHFDAYGKEQYLGADPPPQPGLVRIGKEIDRKLREIVLSKEWAARVPI